MQINKINQTSFMAIHRDSSCKFNEKELVIVGDIEKKLNQINPKDKQKRSYVNYLKEEKGIDIFITKEKAVPNTVQVMGLKGLEESTGDRLLYEDEFIVGEYFKPDFQAKDVISASKNELKELLWAGLLLLGLSSMIALSHSINKGTTIGKAKEVPQKVINIKDKLADSLKNIEFKTIIKK